METVLVTGANGFVGSWCVVELLRNGYAVRGTVRDLSAAAEVGAAIEAQSPQAKTSLAFVQADLTDDAGWAEAMEGCSAVLHVASPLGGSGRGDLVTPARDGTLRVLRAAKEAGVRQVVMTSAAATARPPHGDERVSDETIWADVADPQFDEYRQSKILAERAAWDFVGDTEDTPQLTTILPGAVYGPILLANHRGSTATIGGLLHGRFPALFRVGFWVVDVRDLAALHVRAIGEPAAFGERFIAAGEFLWMEEIAAILRQALGERGAKIPTTALSTEAARRLMEDNAQLRGLAPMLDRVNPLTAAKARDVLGFSPRPARETVVDCAASLLTSG